MQLLEDIKISPNTQTVSVQSVNQQKTSDKCVCQPKGEGKRSIDVQHYQRCRKRCMKDRKPKKKIIFKGKDGNTQGLISWKCKTSNILVRFRALKWIYTWCVAKLSQNKWKYINFAFFKGCMKIPGKLVQAALVMFAVLWWSSQWFTLLEGYGAGCSWSMLD